MNKIKDFIKKINVLHVVSLIIIIGLCFVVRKKIYKPKLLNPNDLINVLSEIKRQKEANTLENPTKIVVNTDKDTQ
ncbi:MAG: hypothetical protein Q8885_01520, partial [Candidatus Phytoplasma stylosanthis]|nr:hypothetical protein [Candidatus Phytoplasma stylosanthis]